MLIDCPDIPAREFVQQHKEKIRQWQEYYAERLPVASEQAITRPVIVNGKRYDSVLIASGETGIPQKAIRDGARGLQAHWGGWSRIPFTAEWAEVSK